MTRDIFLCREERGGGGEGSVMKGAGRCLHTVTVFKELKQRRF